ncbi:MAG TPA: UvrD-helicase domain-containing protein [Candidatus Obscuribacterales bacterium]
MTKLTEQQTAAVTSTNLNVLVSAGAGSGKTHVLVERYVRILEDDPKLTVANLVAVTFTRKAASEMRTRLKSRFQDLFEKANGDEKSRWLSCLSGIDGAKIGTIHSLCESIIRAFPVEAGVDPQFEVLDDIERTELIKLSIDQALREVILEQSQEHELLLAFNLDDVRKWLFSVVSSSLQFQEAAAEFQPLIEGGGFDVHFSKFAAWARRRAIGEFLANPDVERCHDFLKGNEWRDKDNPLEHGRVRCVAICDQLRSESAWSAIVELSEMPAVRAGGNSDEAKALRGAIKELRTLAKAFVAPIPQELNERDPYALKLIGCLISIAIRTIEHYRVQKQSNHKLDYDDLIRLTFAALTCHDSQARKTFNQSLRAILVDEFQDTNKFQSRLIALLAGEQTRIFLIGDDKQSIYKFQGADVSTFNEWKKLLSGGLSAQGLEDLSLRGESRIVSLNRSFRSHPQLVAVVNHVFEDLLAVVDEPEIYRAQFEALDAARGNAGDEVRVEAVLFDSSSFDKGGNKGKVDYEAELIARWINRQVDQQLPIELKGHESSRPARFGDFAVLVQKNGDFAPIEEALARFRIPYVTLGGKSFLRRQEVFDVENLLRFIDNPLDSHSLLAALRSPMFALSDDIIHAVMASDAQFLWQALQRTIKERRPGLESVSQAVWQLKNLIEAGQMMPLGDLLRKIISITNYDLVLMSSHNGQQRSRNLWKLVHLASMHEDLSPGEFAQRLALMRQFNVKQSDAPLDPTDAVKLMTIHGSKGLEFPVVILPALSPIVYSNKSPIIFHKQYGIALNTTRGKDEHAPAWYRLAKLVDKDMEVEERKRLLYVAMTRARDHLALFLDRNSRDVESFRRWLMTALRTSELEDAKQRIIESGDVKWRLSWADLAETEAPEEEQPRIISIATDACVEDRQPVKTVFDLIDPVNQFVDEPPSAFSGLWRITPARTGVQINSTIVGTFFHSLMEHLLHTVVLPTREQIEAVAYAQGETAAHPEVREYLISEGERLLQKFAGSELYELMLKSKRRFHEVPYLTFSEGKLKSGRPDLLLEDNEGNWHLIDYKTDQVPLSELASHARQHTKQLAGYVSELQRLVGIVPRPALYFAQHGILHYMEA